MRSLLFVPGDSERKFARAVQGGADVLILDLEDSVAQSGKALAREATLRMLRSGPRPQQWFVRINALDTGMSLADLAAVMPGAPDGIVLPKCSGAAQVRQLAHYLDAMEAAHGSRAGQTRIIGIATESAASIFALGEYAGCSERLCGLMWGAEDLAASLGATQNREGGAYLGSFRLARELCLMAAAAAGVTAIDSVFVDITDLNGLRREALEGRRDGFSAKAAIHPNHVDTINDAFAPTEADLAWARAVVAAFAAAPEAGVVKLDGQMVDKPHLARANRILASAG
ncbi:HpcH/HpaI aldolase/citrate lyase family protein [Cupriavidus alkaliphilus]|uniref:HpcH/HpaI aldolase/citrate lyase family protein n=1 Tax=Cupriavidus alkaliphilus TaxID=942866 RepID=UPI00339D63D0